MPLQFSFNLEGITISALNICLISLYILMVGCFVINLYFVPLAFAKCMLLRYKPSCITYNEKPVAATLYILGYNRIYQDRVTSK